MGKRYWESKTLWVNVIAFVAMLVQSQTGYAVSPEVEVGILGVVNIILRIVTKEPVSWDSAPTEGAGN